MINLLNFVRQFIMKYNIFINFQINTYNIEYMVKIYHIPYT